MLGVDGHVPACLIESETKNYVRENNNVLYKN